MEKTQLGALLIKNGGLYKAAGSGTDSVMFSVYTGVWFMGLKCDVKRGMSVEMIVDAPSGRARDGNAGKRKAYWESVGKKRLMQGSLVALVCKPAAGEDVRVHLGVITSSLEDLIRSTTYSPEHITLSVSFFETEVEFKVLSVLQNREADPTSYDTNLLVEAPVMFESLRPFLETLKNREPTAIPFSHYLAHPANGHLTDLPTFPPAYASPNYTMKLDVLFSPQRTLSLRPHDSTSIENAREALKKHSVLDPSQADALLDTLTSEFGLIQGCVFFSTQFGVAV